ncbi:MAG TPA: glycoside hydrolase family 3 N-terminal domain-containing protein [Patescibacteria group bacterium]|nr:glycoside hydrolase family 3 N-terminal domain-containing protein [Patescibacteria group bacterium]
MAASLRLAVLLLTLSVPAWVAGCGSAAPAPERFGALNPRLGELLLVGFHGTALEDNAALERLVCETRVAGVILFARNIVNAEQTARLTRELSARARECTGHALLVAVDAEGGRVMRLGPDAGWTETPSHQDLGQAGDLAQTELEARRIGGMLRAAGINWNLAPVVDVGYNPANPVIVGVGRSFGATPTLVAAQARAYITGMHAAGVLTALKHFPGHGSSADDSHAGFVDVTDTARPDVELVPYRLLLAEGVVDAVMTAHVYNRHLDAWVPATLSRPTIDGMLRHKLGWRGVVVSDDMRMGAIEQHYGAGDAAVRALRAGVDLILIADDRLPGDRSASAETLKAIRQAVRRGRLPARRVDEALARVAALRSRLTVAADVR